MNKPTVTTILQCFRRPAYLAEQLVAINNQSIKPDKIIIVQNEGGDEFKFDFPENTHVIYSSVNMKFHLRFVIGLLAQTEYIAFYDDDTCPGRNWHKNCIETIAKHDCVCGTNGRIADRANRRQFGAGWTTPSDDEKQVDFVGHAWFLKRKNLKYMFYEDIIEYSNGEDVQLSANCQRFGNIPTYVPPHPTSDKSLWGSDPLKGMKYGSDKVASYICNRTHHQERYDLFDKYAEKGWKLLLEKNKT